MTALGLLLSTLVLASGCQLFAGDSISTVDVFKSKIATKTGFYGEKFVPMDAAIVGAFDMQDPSQKMAFDKLRGKFVDDAKWEELKNEAYSTPDEDLKEKNMTFKDDILGVFGENPRVVFALDKQGLGSVMNLGFGKKYSSEMPADNLYPDTEMQSIELQPTTGEAASSEEEVDVTAGLIQPADTVNMLGLSATGLTATKFEGNWYLVVKIENVEKYNNMMKYFEEKEEFKKVEGQEKDDVWQVEDAFVGRYQDMMLVTNSLDSWKSAVKRARDGEKNITDNEAFRTVFGNLVYPHAVYFYEDAQASMESTIASLRKGSENASEMEKQLAQKMEDFYRGRMGFMKADGFVMVLEDGGLKFKTYLLADESKLKDSDKGFEDLKGDLTLINKLPGEGVIFYEEIGEGGMGMITDLVANFLPVAGLNVEEIKQQFKSIVGLDWDKDVAAFAKKNIALYLSDTGQILPSFGIALDATADVEAAGRTMQALNSNISLLIASAKSGMAEEDAKVVAQLETDLAGKKVNKLSLDISKLSEASKENFSIEDSMKNMLLELYHGVTGDGVALIAFHPNFDKSYGKATVANSDEFKKALASIGTDFQDGVMIYVNTVPLWAYVDRYVDAFMPAAKVNDETITPEDSVLNSERADYEEFKKYAQPVKFFIMGSKISRTESESMGYLSIQ